LQTIIFKTIFLAAVTEIQLKVLWLNFSNGAATQSQTHNPANTLKLWELLSCAEITAF
jgi:hypothetical protein